MKISTHCIYPPIPIRDYDWSAIDSDTYDGAPDSRNRAQIGYGRTEQEAITDLMNLLEDELDMCDQCDTAYACWMQGFCTNLTEGTTNDD
jgi:hypothetical protein